MRQCYQTTPHHHTPFNPWPAQVYGSRVHAPVGEANRQRRPEESCHALSAKADSRGVWGVVPPQQKTRTQREDERSSANRVSQGQVQEALEQAEACSSAAAPPLSLRRRGHCVASKSTSGRGHRLAQRRRTPSPYKVADIQTSREVRSTATNFLNFLNATNVTPIVAATRL